MMKTRSFYLTLSGMGIMWTCRLVDRPRGKLRTKPVDQVRSLPVRHSAGPHYSYKQNKQNVKYMCCMFLLHLLHAYFLTVYV